MTHAMCVAWHIFFHSASHLVTYCLTETSQAAPGNPRLPRSPFGTLETSALRQQQLLTYGPQLGKVVTHMSAVASRMGLSLAAQLLQCRPWNW
jgi:hypothetical protein